MKTKLIVFPSIDPTVSLVERAAYELASALAEEVNGKVGVYGIHASSQRYAIGIGRKRKKGVQSPLIVLSLSYRSKQAELWFASHAHGFHSATKETKTYAKKGRVGARMFREMVADAKRWLEEGLSPEDRV